MFERFILATDLSPAASAVVDCAAGLRQLGARHGLLLQCLDLQQATSTALSYTTGPLEAALAQQKTSLEAQGFEVETRVVPGFAKREINRIAEQEGYDLVVVGSHGHSIAAEALLGGVATEVIHSARKPVLVVRLQRIAQGEEICTLPAGCALGGHVLFPTDFSENADRAFAVVEALVSAQRWPVTLVHVQDRARIEPHLSGRLAEFDEIDRSRLQALSERLLKLGAPKVDVLLRHGSPAAEIVAAARECDARLLVMGSQGRSLVAEVFLGSVSHRVVREAPAPVLLIPAERSGHRGE